jgi:hypothetical protein
LLTTFSRRDIDNQGNKTIEQNRKKKITRRKKGVKREGEGGMKCQRTEKTQKG